MEQPRNHEDLYSLQKARSEAELQLQRALLEGAPWSEVKAMTQRVTELSIQIHKRKYPLNNTDPSQTAFR